MRLCYRAASCPQVRQGVVGPSKSGSTLPQHRHASESDDEMASIEGFVAAVAWCMIPSIAVSDNASLPSNKDTKSKILAGLGPLWRSVHYALAPWTPAATTCTGSAPLRHMFLHLQPCVSCSDQGWEVPAGPSTCGTLSTATARVSVQYWSSCEHDLTWHNAWSNCSQMGCLRMAVHGLGRVV